MEGYKEKSPDSVDVGHDLASDTQQEFSQVKTFRYEANVKQALQMEHYVPN
jgi:hypothetical protein